MDSKICQVIASDKSNLLGNADFFPKSGFPVQNIAGCKVIFKKYFILNRNRLVLSVLALRKKETYSATGM